MLESRQRHESVDQGFHPARLREHRFVRFRFIARFRSREHRTEISGHDGKRRAQLMSRICDELSHLRFGLVTLCQRSGRLIDGRIISARELCGLAAICVAKLHLCKGTAAETPQCSSGVDERPQSLVGDDQRDAPRCRQYRRSKHQHEDPKSVERASKALRIGEDHRFAAWKWNVHRCDHRRDEMADEGSPPGAMQHRSRCDEGSHLLRRPHHVNDQPLTPKSLAQEPVDAKSVGM